MNVDNATIQLAAQKVFYDYMSERGNNSAIEPESFFEHWVEKMLINSDRELNECIWRAFMNRLVEATKGKKG